MGQKHTPGPWHLCQHLKGMKEDAACPCGYRGVIYGPEHDIAYAICQPGHEPAPPGQEGSEPARYPREVELANARLISGAPDLLEHAEKAVIGIREAVRVLDLMGRGEAARNLSLYDSNLNFAIAKATGE